MEIASMIDPQIYYNILLSFNKDEWKRTYTYVMGDNLKKTFSEYINDAVREFPWEIQDDIKRVIAAKVIELFPDRVESYYRYSTTPNSHYGIISNFNTHADTTYEDVQLVLEQLAFPEK